MLLKNDILSNRYAFSVVIPGLSDDLNNVFVDNEEFHEFL